MVTEIKKVGSWKDRIAACKKFYEPMLAQWERYKKYYANDHWFDQRYYMPETEDRITVNQVFPLIKVMLNSTYSKNPYVYITPAYNDDQSFWAAKVLEPFVNRMWAEDQRMKRMMRRVSLDAIIRGKGFVRSGYSIESLGETNFRDSIISERVSPLHFWIDPEAESVYDAYYTIRRVVLPWVDVKRMWPKKSGELAPASRYELRPSEKDNTNIMSGIEWNNNPNLNDDMARAIIYEIHDHLNRKISVIAEGHDKFLSHRDDPYDIGGSLIDELCFNEIPETPFALSDVAVMEGQQLELNRLRTMMMQHVRRFLRKYVTTRDNFNEDEKKALESDEDGIVIECEDPGAIVPIKDAPLSSDVHVYEQRIMGDMHQSTGMNEWLKGGMISPKKTAFEASEIAQGSNLRIGEKPALMEDFASRVAEKQVRIMQQFMDSPIIDNIPMCPLGVPLNAQGLKAFSREDLQGEFKVVVKQGSTQLPDKNVERQLAMGLYQAGMGQDPMMRDWFYQWFSDSMDLPGMDKHIGRMAGGGQQQQGQPDGNVQMGQGPPQGGQGFGGGS